MPNMHWCTGKVNLAGQNFTVIWFDATNPISWPEAQVLKALHGEENVYELAAIGVSNVSVSSEKERLQMKYGWKPTEVVFPGRNPRMEQLMPAESEYLPPVDGFGQLTGEPAPQPPEPSVPGTVIGAAAPKVNGEQDDEDEDDPAIDPAIPPSGPAQFKPGRHTPPRKGA